MVRGRYASERRLIPLGTALVGPGRPGSVAILEIGEPGVVPACIGIIGAGISTTGVGVGVGVASIQAGGVGVVPGSGVGSISTSSEVGGSVKAAAGVGLGVAVGVVGVAVALGLGVASVNPMAPVSWPKTGRAFPQRRAAAKNDHAKERRLSTCVISDKVDAKGRKIGEPHFIASGSQ